MKECYREDTREDTRILVSSEYDYPENDEGSNQNGSQNSIDRRAHFARLSGVRSKDPKKENSCSTASTMMGSNLSNQTSSIEVIQSSLRNSKSKCVWLDMVSAMQDKFEDDELDGSQKNSCCKDNCTKLVYSILYQMCLFCRTSRSNRYIPLSSLFVFAALVTVGITTIVSISNNSEMQVKNLAISEAEEAGDWFVSQFSRSILSLYSLQQTVKYSEYFKDLPNKIGHYGANESAPINHGPYHKNILNYRNVTGICDDNSLKEEFREIVWSLNSAFDINGSVVSYRLAPNNVFCLAEPLANTVDFDDIGKDLLFTPENESINRLRAIYSADEARPYFEGPLKFSQNDVNQGVNLSEVFHVYLDVRMPGYNMTIEGKSYSSWGFVMNIIDWSKLKKDSEISKRFKKKNFEYHLFKIQTDCCRGGTGHSSHVTTIARSDNWRVLKAENSVNVDFEIFGQKWTICVGYEDGFQPPWRSLAIVVTVFLAFLVSIMFMIILIERQLHKQLLFKIMPESAVRKIHRGQTVIEGFNLVTIFFSDIVDFTSIAGDMRPIQVMEMLNELYTSFDGIVAKHDVYKVETIGDAYMVVGGAPNRTNSKHAAEQIALFALEATEFVKKFQTSLGDKIHIRVGIASGPAVAGVVGKSMPRYCFFGDTVNLASRMESTSKTMKIQCSDVTMQLLVDAPNYIFNMDHRRDNVEVKGKDDLNTYWINGATKIDLSGEKRTDTEYGTRRSTDLHLETIHDDPQLSSSHVSSETHLQFEATTGQEWSNLGQDEGLLVVATAERDTMIVRLVSILETRLIALMRSRNQKTPLDDVTKRELRAYVEQIESLYNGVEYHSFEHASHVTISMNKLISTQCANAYYHQDCLNTNQESSQNSFISFMMVYAALVHDVCHTGKSNKILQDQEEIFFKNLPSPLAEHLSINTAVQILDSKEFSNLRAAIIPTEDIRIEFGRVLYCAILCTDVASPDRLKDVRERFDTINNNHQDIPPNPNNWDSTHVSPAPLDFNQRLCPLLPHLDVIHQVLAVPQTDSAENHSKFLTTCNTLPQVVFIEHLMQVADVAHCMQGWENFIKWNYRLYREFMDCYKKKLISEPSRSWSAGQIGFINNYIIPLAERTERCCESIGGLNLVESAKKNRNRWANEGEFISSVFRSATANEEDEKTVFQKCFEKNNNIKYNLEKKDKFLDIS